MPLLWFRLITINTVKNSLMVIHPHLSRRLVRTKRRRGLLSQRIPVSKSLKSGFENALTLEKLEAMAKAGTFGEAVIPVEKMFGALPAVSVREAGFKALRNGNF